MTWQKSLRYKIEAGFLYVFYGIFSILPIDFASALGGWLGRMIGPRLAASRKAYRNLERALPGKTDGEYRQIITHMWDNLGRVFAEYPHLEEISKTRTTIINPEKLHRPDANDRPVILIAAHMANWEIIAPTLYFQKNMAGTLVYRAPNNPAADKLLLKARSLSNKLSFTTKSERGVRDMIKVLKNGGNIGLLIDQKFNKGLEVPFFNHPAMTSPAFVELAERFHAVIIPLQIERTQGAHFQITVHNPLDQTDKTIEDLLRETHIMLEDWIKQRPAQWLWLHRRWKD